MTAAKPWAAVHHARSASGGEDVQEIADAALACEWIGQAAVGGDGVMVASAPAFAHEVAGVDQLSDHPVARSVMPTCSPRAAGHLGRARGRAAPARDC
jgi:NAD-dependent oxidoreductase involved in siderophore biosynthesis